MIRILLADDHFVVRRGLRAVLDEHPDLQICAETGNGRDAVALAQQHRPDVAILDIALPILSGIDATRQIRKVAPATEVLIFTSHHDEDMVRDAIVAGARGYVLKLESDGQIIRAIEALARRHEFFFSSQVSDALLVPVDDARLGSHSGLTSREREVVQLVADGHSNKKIATRLEISVKTVETHRAAAMHKLDIHSTAELVRYAVRHKLVEP